MRGWGQCPRRPSTGGGGVSLSRARRVRAPHVRRRRRPGTDLGPRQHPGQVPDERADAAGYWRLGLQLRNAGVRWWWWMWVRGVLGEEGRLGGASASCTGHWGGRGWGWVRDPAGGSWQWVRRWCGWGRSAGPADRRLSDHALGAAHQRKRRLGRVGDIPCASEPRFG